jgi:hypothetical protein
MAPGPQGKEVGVSSGGRGPNPASIMNNEVSRVAAAHGRM